MMQRLRLFVAVLGLAGLLLAGCGAGSDEAASGTGGDETAAEDAESPLAEALGFDLDNPDAMSDMQRDIERKTQECMRAQGFEYELLSTGDTGAFADRSTMSDEEYAANHGYGITESFLSFADRGGVGADPNAEMLDAMSDGERDAWNTALSGAPSDEADSVGFLPSGCRGEAASETMAGIMAIQQLGPQIQKMQDEMAADPRMIEISDRWSTCMGEKGYNFSSNTEAFESINRKLTGVMASINPTANELTPEMRQQLDEVKTEEVEVASADLACIGPDREEAEAIRREYELRFVEENKAVIDGLGS